MTDYAMRLLTYVAQQSDRLCTISEFAKAYDISDALLMKITHQLGLNGWLETVRGQGGGMRLTAAPAEINLGRSFAALSRLLFGELPHPPHRLQPHWALQAHRYHE